MGNYFIIITFCLLLTSNCILFKFIIGVNGLGIRNEQQYETVVPIGEIQKIQGVDGVKELSKENGSGFSTVTNNSTAGSLNSTRSGVRSRSNTTRTTPDGFSSTKDYVKSKFFPLFFFGFK